MIHKFKTFFHFAWRFVAFSVSLDPHLTQKNQKGMKRYTNSIWMVALLVIGGATQVRADGEAKVEPGTQWVDPVAFYELQDVTTADLKRDYDQGDIDVNKVMTKKGVKIYGLKLKPIAVAGHVEGQHQFGELEDADYSYKFNYQDILGVKGVPLSDAPFCIYSDQFVSRSYKLSYDYNRTITLYHGGPYGNSPSTDSETMHLEAMMNFHDIHLVSADGGVGVSYAMDASGRYEAVRYWNSEKGQEIKASKIMGADPTLGHFIYYQGSQHLLLMLAADQQENYKIYLSHFRSGGVVDALTAEQEAQINRPWARVYFEVTEMLVAETKGLSEEERTALIKQGDDLMAWLNGEGDPLGLGEHTDAMTSAVINMLSIISAILVGNSIVSFTGGGAGGSLASMLQKAGGPQPPADPTPPNMDATDPKKKEDEDDDTPPDPNKFTPTNHPDLCNQYLTQQPDGDIVVKSPVTGKDQHYYNQGDGTWISDSGIAYDKEDIENRLRYEAENAGTLKQDYETAQTYQQRNDEAWEQKKNTSTKWLTDKEAAEMAEAERKQDMLNKLGLKYHVADPTEENIRKAIEEEKQRAKDQLLWAMKRDVKLSAIITGLEVVDKGAETFVYAAGNALGPGMGAKIRDLYTMGKAVGVASVEAVIDKDKGFDHVVRGVVKGGVGILQHHAGGLVKDLPVGDTWKGLAQGSIWVGSNSITGALKGYEKAGSDIYEVGEGAQIGLQQKGAAWAISKAAGIGYNYASDMEAKHNFLGVAIPKEIATGSGNFNVGKATGTVAAKTIMAIPDLWKSAKEISQAASNYEIAKNI